MKHLFIVWVLFSCLTFLAHGQSVTFSFTGKKLNTDTPMNIDSVYIFNNSNASDTLVIGNTFSTSITSIDVSEIEKNNGLIGYPNPFEREAILTFNSKYNERAKVSLYTLDGKHLVERESNITPGENKFRLKSGVTGVLLLSIVSKNMQLNSK